MVSVFRRPRSTARERNASIAAMDVLAALSAALAALRAGRIDDARRAAERIWRQSSDARAAGFLALLETDAGRYDSALSRESAFLGNNLVLLGVTFVVLLGTIFPLIVEALTNRQVTVGGPYFKQTTIPRHSTGSRRCCETRRERRAPGPSSPRSHEPVIAAPKRSQFAFALTTLNQRSYTR